MKEKNEKIKTWFDEHKEELASNAIRIVYYAAGVVIGYFVADKISNYKFGVGLMDFHHKGILKFLDPSTGLEIDVHKACEIMSQMNK